MWQETFEKYREQGFTVVGIALDAEGIEPAKLYYEKFNVTFPALVDPNYATGLAAVPKTIFVSEHGVVRPEKNWEERLRPRGRFAPVTDSIRRQWTDPAARLDPTEIARLARAHQTDPTELKTAVDLASRYLDLELRAEAATVIRPSLEAYDPKKVALSEDARLSGLLAQAYFQLSRASVGDREEQIRHATTSFFLNPTVGYGKQIARIIAPEKFDGRPDGDFDNEFREGTLRRLRQERAAWLQQE